MDFLEIIYGVLRGLLTEAIIRVIDSRGEIKEILTTSFLMKLNKKKSKMEIDRNTFFTMGKGKIFDKE